MFVLGAEGRYTNSRRPISAFEVDIPKTESVHRVLLSGRRLNEHGEGGLQAGFFDAHRI
jgi:hypothetical protein